MTEWVLLFESAELGPVNDVEIAREVWSLDVAQVEIKTSDRTSSFPTGTGAEEGEEVHDHKRTCMRQMVKAPEVQK